MAHFVYQRISGSTLQPGSFIERASLAHVIASCVLFRMRHAFTMSWMKVKVVVMPKAAVLDPQGNAVRDAMRHLGMPEVRSVRIGKYMEIDIHGENGELESRLHSLCRELLSNPVIEDYELQQEKPAKRKRSK
jgi:phosphoribosylformylglycinamidine synthase subunit PurS